MCIRDRAYAVVFVAMWWAVVAVMDRRKLYLKL